MGVAFDPLTLRSFPKAILHIDGDAFFTSVEQALHPHLRGRPVVTGSERGIIACASYEAKRIGISRGVSLWEARKAHPGLVVLPSDYETYSLMSKRMFDIMRRFTPEVEEYSIDEGFADITGMRSYFKQSYPDIARSLQSAIHKELDLTVSVGLAPTKSIAKIASDYRKPSGLTIVPANRLHQFLPKVPLEDVWGLGRNRVALLEKFGLQTAWDYVRHDERWIRKLLHKPGVEMWHELRGTAVMPLDQAAHAPKASISKTKTFSAPSSCPDYVYARLLRNIESACIKLRRHHLLASEFSISLRSKDYREHVTGIRLNRPTQYVQELLPALRILFDHIHTPKESYRATGVVFAGLSDDRQYQYDLFTDPVRIEQMRELGHTVDKIQKRFGKHVVCQATGLYMASAPKHARDTPAWRKSHLLPGETARKRIRIPMLEIKV